MKVFIKNIKKALFPFFVLAFISAESIATEQGRGRVNMQGSVIDAACSIVMSDRFQTVDISYSPIAELIQQSSKVGRSFSINLEGCSLQSDGPPAKQWSHFQVTFDGLSDDGKLFSLMGNAQGVGLEISDKYGNVATPGEPLPEDELIPDLMTLNFRLNLKGNGLEIKPGDYRSVIRFKVDYF